MATEKIVYQLNQLGEFVGEVFADESPLEPGIYLIPASCVEVAPPAYVAGTIRIYVDGAWLYKDMVHPAAEPTPAPPQPTAEQLWADCQTVAFGVLRKSDLVALRCFKAGVPFPPDWQSYVANLRAIVAAPAGDPALPLPTIPAYPAGT